MSPLQLLTVGINELNLNCIWEYRQERKAKVYEKSLSYVVLHVHKH